MEPIRFISITGSWIKKVGSNDVARAFEDASRIWRRDKKTTGIPREQFATWEDYQLNGCNVDDKIVITLTTENSTDLTVTINGKPYSVDNNKVTIENGLEAGDYIISAVLAGNENYTAAVNSTTFKVKPAATSVSIDVKSVYNAGEDIIRSFAEHVFRCRTGIHLAQRSGTERSQPIRNQSRYSCAGHHHRPFGI